MPEIKFRVFLDGSDYEECHEDHGVKRMLSWEDLCDGTDPLEYYLKNDIEGCSDPMQFTGLRDKTGKEIYEGDILKTSWLVVGPVTADWTHGLRFLVFNDQLVKADEVYGEVLGNIYENPELIKEKK